MKANQHEITRLDFIAFLDEIGTTIEQVKAYRNGLHDMAPLPSEFDHVRAMPSPIDGLGLFTTTDLKKNQLIAPARIHGTETLARRYVNHSPIPNARMITDVRGNPSLVALRDIGGDCTDEIVLDYRQARQALGLRTNCLDDQTDFAALLVELGLTDQQAKEALADNMKGPFVPLADEYEHLHVAASRIHGLGLFSSRPIRQGELVVPMRAGLPTTAALYANHAAKPTTRYVIDVHGHSYLVAKDDLDSFTELTFNYRDALKNLGLIQSRTE